MDVVVSLRESGQEGVVEENYDKLYVYPPWDKEHEKPSPEEEEEEGMRKEFGVGVEFGFDPGFQGPEMLERRNKLMEEKKGRRYENFEKSTHTIQHGEGRKKICESLESTEKLNMEMFGVEGFDDFPCDSKTALLVPLAIRGNGLLDDLCRKALAEFNSLNGSDYKFVEVEMAYQRSCAGLLAFVTFRAREPHLDSLVTFQAGVHHFVDRPAETRVYFCKIKSVPEEKKSIPYENFADLKKSKVLVRGTFPSNFDTGKDPFWSGRVHRGYPPSDKGSMEAKKKLYMEMFGVEGFDGFPCGFKNVLLIPCAIRGNELFDDLCKKALAEFNSLNGNDYKFVEMEMAYQRSASGVLAFVTFHARKPHLDSLVTFQACVHHVLVPEEKKSIPYENLEDLKKSKELVRAMFPNEFDTEENPFSPERVQRDYVPFGNVRMEAEAMKKINMEKYGVEGFDDFPCGAKIVRLIPFPIRGDKWLDDLCGKALAEFNSLNGSDYKFVWVKKAYR